MIFSQSASFKRLNQSVSETLDSRLMDSDDIFFWTFFSGSACSRQLCSSIFRSSKCDVPSFPWVGPESQKLHCCIEGAGAIENRDHFLGRAFWVPMECEEGSIGCVNFNQTSHLVFMWRTQERCSKKVIFYISVWPPLLLHCMLSPTQYICIV